MTATDDERREAAARLRKCGAELSIIGADCETGFHVIDKVIGCRDVDSWERFLARLADLIEPPEITEDTSDFSPENLVLVERRSWALMARRGCSYSDADSLMCSEVLAALEAEARSAGAGRRDGTECSR